MKKYNLSNIMKRAWELAKKEAMTLSQALKKAWALFSLRWPSRQGSQMTMPKKSSLQ